MKKQLLILGVAAIIGLSGCGKDTNNDTSSKGNKESTHAEMDHSKMDDRSMDHSMHSSSGEVPKDLKEAANPAYMVGSQAIIKASHMEGMDGATATIVGAYDTIAYAVSYTPTTGGEMVKNHKWVIQQEIKDAGSEPLEPGTDVTIEADHMEGMKGASGKIDSAEKTTVYMVDYTPATGGEKVKNHKWVTESELAAK